jgi:hypothetical protein
MSNVSRRQFLRNASLGAAAAGALAVGGTSLVTAIASTGSPSALPDTNDEPLDGSDVFARVVDAKAGKIKIYVGKKEVDYTNQSLAQQLLRASQ